MQAYIIRRLLLVVPTLLIVTIIVFFGLRFIPGDAVDLMVTRLWGMSGEADPREAIRQQLGLHLPIHVQYGRWMSGVLRGDLGTSVWSQLSVTEQVFRRLPVSLELGIMAILVSLLIALPVGIYSGIRPDTRLDHLLRSISILFICVPGFWVATIIMIYPAIWWGWSPPMLWIPFREDPLANLGMVIIPAAILGMWLSGVTMRLTRTMVLEVLRQDYVRTAWAKGLKEKVVIVRHVLKNSLIPLVTMVGLQLPVMIGGAVVVESIFTLPGVGWLMFDAIRGRDYPIVSGINIVMATFVLLINIVIDISYSWLDPRIRYK
jgi:peptide/nickel transport system permease protein